MTEKNRIITLASRPKGFPTAENFSQITADVPQPGEGQFLARTLWLSVDPYMRGRMNDVKSYAPPVQIGEVMTGGTVSEVVTSNHPKFKVGDIVAGNLGWQDYAVTDGAGSRKVDPSIAPVSTALGVLGMPGLTAYFGLLDIGAPKAGETVLVSGAAGAVGSIVGQIAKIKGCHVVGSAGGAEKAALVKQEFGYDESFDYKTLNGLRDYQQKLGELCPKGIDVFFDNVGGDILDAVLIGMNPHARLALCGQISQYNLETLEMGPRLLGTLVRSQAKMEGFLVFQFQDRFETGLKEMAGWIKEGKLKYRETIAEGLENTPQAFFDMMRGKNVGKQLVKVV